MTDKRKAQLGFEVDGSGTKAGFDQVKQGANETAKVVVDAGKTASKGLDAIGDGAKRAADSLSREESRIAAAIKRTVFNFETLGKTASEKFELRIDQKGLDSAKFEPALARLRDLEGGLQRTGVSAAQTAAALRLVPAQFTDIATSLAGGQSPLTVLLQQGGQLKDSFGGIGPAARALGGYVAGLINPFTLAAGAVGALGVAYFKGASEGEEFRKQIILSGNAAGVTAGQLQGMAVSIAGVVGTQGKAAEVLAQLVATGRVSRESMQGVAAAIVRTSEATGVATEKLVDDFASLGKAPAESVLKLDEKYRFLTASIYEQISALEKQGRVEEAAALAQSTLSSTLDDRSKSVVANLGLIETAWNGVAKAVKEAGNYLLEIGRDRTDEKLLEEARAKLQSMQSLRAFNERIFGSSAKTGPERDQELVVANLNAKILQQGASARRQAAQRQIEEQGAYAVREVEQQRAALASASEKMEADLRKYRSNIDKIRAANPGSALLDPTKIAADEAAIRDKYTDKDAARKAARDAKDAQAELSKALALVDDLSAKQDGFAANYGEQVALLSNAMRKGAISSEVYGRSMELLLQRQPFAVEQTRRQAEAEREFQADRKRRFEEVERQYQQEVRAAEQSAKAVTDRVQSMQDEESAIQRSITLNITLAQALADVREARLIEARSQALASGEQERADAINAEIKATRELASLTDRKTKRDGANEAMKDLLKGDLGTDFAAGFDKASASLGTFVEQFARLAKLQEDYAKAKEADNLTDKQRAELDNAFVTRQVGSYASLAGAAKGFFKQQSDGYRALQTAEQVLRAVELASSAQRIAAKFAEGQAVAAVGVANQASGDPYTAPFRMAAMAATMAALGFAVSGAFGGGSAALPSNKGTGTVLGDPAAASESITKAIDDLSNIDTMTMRYSAAMAASLRNIEGNIGGLAALLVQSGGLDSAAAGIQTGFKQDALGRFISGGLAGAQLGSMVGGLLAGPIGVIAGGILGGPLAKAVGNLFGTKTTIIGQGLTANAQSVGSILDSGFDASYFTDIEKKKKFLGATTSKKVRTQFSDADALLERQIGTIFSGFANALVAAAEPLGRNLDQVSGAIRGFVVDIGRVDLKGLSGEQISERLTNVFSAAGDRLAGFALGGLEAFQRVGEGYLQTVIRTASGVEQATVALRQFRVSAINYSQIANKQGDVAAELVRDSLLATEALGGVADILKVIDGDAADIVEAYKGLTDARLSLQLLGFNSQAIGFDLIQGAGGLQALTDSLKAFEDGFLSDSEQVDVATQRMAKQFQLLGFSLPGSGEAFAALVRGIDTSTASGRELLGNVLQLSGGFSELLQALQDVGSGIESEIERIRGLSGGGGAMSLAQLQADFAIKTAQARAGDQSAIDALPKASKALLDASQAQASSSLEVARLQAQTLASLEATLKGITDPAARLKSIQGFASGGDFGGGLRLVGEAGPELEVTGPARIFDAATTAQILAGAGGNAEVAGLLRQVLALLEQVRSDQVTGDVTIARNTGQLVTLINRVVRADALQVQNVS